MVLPTASGMRKLYPIRVWCNKDGMMPFSPTELQSDCKGVILTKRGLWLDLTDISKPSWKKSISFKMNYWCHPALLCPCCHHGVSYSWRQIDQTWADFGELVFVKRKYERIAPRLRFFFQKGYKEQPSSLMTIPLWIYEIKAEKVRKWNTV